MNSWWLANFWAESPILAISWVFWVIFSICLHELGHGYMAIKCGDSTPLDRGHMTWNPLVHMGWISLAVFAVAGFTWGAMPVDPSRFRGRYDEAEVAFAGPAVNIILFVLLSIATAGWLVFAKGVPDQARENIFIFLRVGAAFNIAGALFNLLPVPPLDGSRIVGNFFPAFHRLYSTERGAVVSLLFFMAMLLWFGRYLYRIAFQGSAWTIDILATLFGIFAPGATP
jgi:Zn-dependent protease